MLENLFESGKDNIELANKYVVKYFEPMKIFIGRKNS